MPQAVRSQPAAAAGLAQLPPARALQMTARRAASIGRRPDLARRRARDRHSPFPIWYIVLDMTIDEAAFSPLRSFLVVVRRDLRLALRQGGDAAMVVAFFVLTVILFPFGVGPAPELLSRIGSGIVWVTALLAALLSLERLFLADYEDGSLEGLALTRLPLELTVLAKIAAHWLVTGLPLIAVAPVLAFLLGID